MVAPLAGDEAKFQVEYARRGPSYFAEGDNFTPEARTGGPRRVVAGDPVAFDAGRSFDVDGTIVSYEWSFGDGETETGPMPAHVYAQAGTYTATLTVTDDHGAVGTDAAAIAVFGDHPVAGTTERASVGPHGEQGTGYSPDGAYLPAISGDGSVVAFVASENGLGVPGGRR